MIKPFHGDYNLTQGFGENPDSYAKFGIKGHNGLDYGLPTGTQVIAPHDGKVIEAANDPSGYGNYLKIENDKEGSVLAHLQVFQVKVGDMVSEGQPIALSNNTGNSTGPHLHWGYYVFPRDRQNGYAGFINQLDLINKDQQKMVTLPQKEVDDMRNRRDELYNENQDLKRAQITLNQKIDQQADTIKIDARNDYDLGVKNMTLEGRLNAFISTLGLPAHTSDDIALEKIKGLLKPHDELVKQVVPVMDQMAEAAIYKRNPTVIVNKVSFLELFQKAKSLLIKLK